MNQNRLKSWAVWVAVIGQVATILVLAGIEPGQVETWQAIAMAVGEILTVLGILNNPVDKNHF